MWVINQEDVKEFVAKLGDTMDFAAQSLLIHASEEAVKSLHDYDEKEGHESLAELWDHTVPERLADGSWLGEVFSHAEDMTFFDKTSRAGVGRVTSSKYPIKGLSLLSILEGGAKAHPISAVNAKTLAFPSPGFEEQVLARSHDVGDYTPGDTSKGAFGFPQYVLDHPGVVGNANVEKTGDEIERMMDDWCEEAANGIAQVMNG